MAPVIKNVKHRLDEAAASVQGKAITKMMMVPGESPPLRLPTQDMPSVAVCKLRQVREFEEKGEHTDFGMVDYGAIVYGEPSLTHIDGPYIYIDNCVGSLTFNSRETHHTPIETPYWTLDTPAVGVATVQTLSIESWWPLVGIRHSDPRQQPHRRPILEVDGIPFAWMNTGEELWINGGTVAGGGTGTVILGIYRLHTPGIEPTQIWQESFTWTGGKIIRKPLAWSYTGWVGIKSETLSVAQGVVSEVSVSLEILGKKGFAYSKLHYLPELDVTPHVAREARRTAASLLVSNRSNAFVAQGNVIAARLVATFPGGRTQDIWDKLKGAADVYSNHAQKGCYTYLEFDFSDEEFKQYVNGYGSPLVHWPNGMMNVITIRNTSSNPNTYQTVFDMIMEFRTASQLYPRAVSLLSNADLIEARRINNMTVYFYENEMHWSDIAKYISTVWKWTRNHSTGLGTALSMAFPEAAPVIMPIARILQT